MGCTSGNQMHECNSVEIYRGTDGGETDVQATRRTRGLIQGSIKRQRNDVTTDISHTSLPSNFEQGPGRGKGQGGLGRRFER